MVTLILLITGIILVLVNYNGLKKGNNINFNDTFNKAAEHTDEYDFKLINIRKEFAETILELQQEVEDLKDKIEENTKKSEETKMYAAEEGDTFEIDNDNKNELTDMELEVSDQKEDVPDELQQSNNVKVKEIEELLHQGLSIDMICEKLGIGKGEVLLIEKLYLK